MFRFDQQKFERVLLGYGGVFGRLARRLKIGIARREQPKSRLKLLDRISLAPRQSLVLVEAEGRRILVATSHESGCAFFPLDGSPAVDSGQRNRHSSKRFSNGPRLNSSARLSW